MTTSANRPNEEFSSPISCAKRDGHSYGDPIVIVMSEVKYLDANMICLKIHFRKINFGGTHFEKIHFGKIHFGKIHFGKIHFGKTYRVTQKK